MWLNFEPSEARRMHTSSELLQQPAPAQFLAAVLLLV